MRYRDDLDRSAEYLRLAIPLMSKQEAGLHPVSYAIWYECVSGMNMPLRQEVESLTKDGKRLNEDLTIALYEKHIADAAQRSTQQVNTQLRQLLDDVQESTAQAGDSVWKFGSAMEQRSRSMEANPDKIDLRAEVAAIMGDTRVIGQSMESLRNSLDESTKEIERLRRELDRSREEAITDGLTGVLNRKGFDQALTASIAIRNGQDVGPSLVMIDIDHFKKVNDTYGHVFGDRVLRTVAYALKASVKGRDTVARYGGEEFALLLPDTPLEGAAKVAEQIRNVIERSHIKRMDKDETVANITLSAGVACYMEQEPPTRFVRRADEALYASKNGGRNRVTLAR